MWGIWATSGLPFAAGSSRRVFDFPNVIGFGAYETAENQSRHPSDESPKIGPKRPICKMDGLMIVREGRRMGGPNVTRFPDGALATAER